MSDNLLLSVENVKKYFSVKKKWREQQKYIKAVDGVTFHVVEGETLGIVGESGSGKSTVAKLILQLLTPSEGTISFKGKNIAQLSSSEGKEVKKNIQTVFQDPYSSLNPRMRAKDIVTEPLLIHQKLSKKEREAIALQLLEEVGLSREHLNRYPHEFSGGQRQRLSIARAISLKPDLIVCDEAVSALDVSIQAQILNLLKQLQRDHGIAFIFIAHGLPAVKHISHRIAIMYAGKIVEVADREEMFTSPKHPYTKALIDSIPTSDPFQRKERELIKGEPPSVIDRPPGCPFHTRCPYAEEICRSKEPKLEEVSKGNSFACHFPLNIN
ncbi:ABC transporter ATP-binding protein [Evansella sp. AB-rgal1]|uniref:ABC transporter ATP-binding protein n=1 Tax=Evansella sp. AB-rgal1 TaxID=3242696 RepID=UPI00359EBC40